ncbi:ABC transporter ATP-binding protein, partial [Paenibacillus sp. MMS18-CY102]|uniref:ABC transporter ATP-binding protein n=1 Tax=Paenibacillus sp. MMS18-CY102 TaxID=2682849 RepID=UPI001365C5B5
MEASWHIHELHAHVNGHHILRGAAATFAPGTITLVIGHNGAGKSTFLETMAGLRYPSSGSILLGEQSLWRGKKLNRLLLLHAGVAVQQSASQWFLPTVEAEFRYTLKPYRAENGVDAGRQAMASALSTVGLPVELLSQDPRTLSGGQQKRLALAMLLVTKVRWLLLDEPTAGLDMDGTRQLCRALEAHRAAGGGAVIVTHDLEALLPLADAVIVIDNGVASATMTPSAWAAQAVGGGAEASSVGATCSGAEPSGHVGASAGSATARPRVLPLPLQAAAQLRAAGFAVPAGAPWAPPQALAAA